MITTYDFALNIIRRNNGFIIDFSNFISDIKSGVVLVDISKTFDQAFQGRQNLDYRLELLSFIY